MHSYQQQPQSPPPAATTTMHATTYNNSSNATQQNKNILNEEKNVIKLIRLFRGHECLWNPNCDEYRNLALKESIWQSIAEQMDRHVTADQVKRKIKGLRNCYSTERNRVQKSFVDGRGEVYVPTLYYYKEFEFLYGITKGISKLSYGNIKAEYGVDYEENTSHAESLYNNNCIVNETPFNQSEANEDMKIFEPIVMSKEHDEHQQYYEIPSSKRMRTRSSYNAAMRMPERTSAPNYRQVESLCEMIKVDLHDVSEELFFDAKWKIMDILRDVHRKHLEKKKCQSFSNDEQTNSSISGHSGVTSSAAITQNAQQYQPN